MRWLILVHRWIGVVLCLLFSMWFLTGMVMMYVPFPSLAKAERLASSSTLDLSSLDEPIADLIDRVAGTVDRVRLIASPVRRPLLVVETISGETAAFFTDTHETAPMLSMSEARDAAEQFSGTRAAGISGPFDFDQWVVHQGFDRYRPYFRVDLLDRSQTSLYVSGVTGEIVQRTTGWQRRWNYVGAVMHWIYPTIIRKNWILWDRLVWWLSLIGVVGTTLGLVLGIEQLRNARRRGRRGLASPYIGWLRWHHKLGLISGAAVFTWILSGWLSMDHGRLFSVPEPTLEQIRQFRGLDLRAAARRLSSRELRMFSGAKELEIVAVGGAPAVVRRTADSSRVLVFDGRAAPRVIEEADLTLAVRSAWPHAQIAESRRLAEDDAYTHLREGSLGDAVQRFVLADRDATWIHVDLESATVVSVMDRSRRLYRWMFNGLHSLDIPGIVERRPLWDALMLSLLICGFAFSSTGVVIGCRRIRRAAQAGGRR